MECLFYNQQKQKEEIEKLALRVDEIANKKSEVIYKTYNDKPKLAGAIIFLGVTIIFCTGFFLGWHWGWLTTIAIFSAGVSFSVSENTV